MTPMALAEKIWSSDWPSRILKRVQETGAKNLLDFFESRPSIPYLKLAKDLGPDVASIQLVRLQFAEAGQQRSIRNVVKDASARLCHQHLKRGWGKGVHLDFNTAAIYAELVSYLKMREDGEHFVEKWNAVWRELMERQPPAGWLPVGPTDPILEAAFENGWPIAPPTNVTRKQLAQLCPICTAVLVIPNANVDQISCQVCGKLIKLI
jgi:hypothetical protein